MSDTAAVVAVVVALAGIAGVVGAVGTGAADGADQVAANDSGVAPGERMAGVVGAERASVESEVAVRAFDRRVAAADSSRAKARVVVGQLDDLHERLDELDAERAELERARENGTLSRGEYRARLARLYAEERALRRLANRTEHTARGLPAETLREQGVNVTAIEHLRADARNLTGPEVAAVARNVAGRSVGRPVGAGPSDNRTREPPDETGPGDGQGADPADNETSPGNGQGADPAGNETSPGDGQGADPADNETGPGDGGSGNGGQPGEGGSGNGSGDSRPGNGGPPEDDADGAAVNRTSGPG